MDNGALAWREKLIIFYYSENFLVKGRQKKLYDVDDEAKFLLKSLFMVLIKRFRFLFLTQLTMQCIETNSSANRRKRDNGRGANEKMIEKSWCDSETSH